MCRRQTLVLRLSQALGSLGWPCSGPPPHRPRLASPRGPPPSRISLGAGPEPKRGEEEAVALVLRKQGGAGDLAFLVRWD